MSVSSVALMSGLYFFVLIPTAISEVSKFFSVKGHIVNILGFVCHIIYSVAITQFDIVA